MAKKTTTTASTTEGATVKTAKTTAAKTTTKAKKPDLSQLLSEIEKRSYELYEERMKNGISGSDLEDWLTAEAEIKNKYKI